MLGNCPFMGLTFRGNLGSFPPVSPILKGVIMELSMEPQIRHYAICAVDDVGRLVVRIGYDGEVEVGSHLSISESAKEFYKLLGEFVKEHGTFGAFGSDEITQLRQLYADALANTETAYARLAKAEAILMQVVKSGEGDDQPYVAACEYFNQDSGEWVPNA